MYRELCVVTLTGFLNLCLLHEINAFEDITFHESEQRSFVGEYDTVSKVGAQLSINMVHRM